MSTSQRWRRVDFHATDYKSHTLGYGDMTGTHYDTLEVARSASVEVIRAAYRSLSHRWHPDRNPDDRTKADRMMKSINGAYAVLSDPQKLAAYDAELDTKVLAQQSRTPPPAQELAPHQPPSDSAAKANGSGLWGDFIAGYRRGYAKKTVTPDMGPTHSQQVRPEPKGWLRFLIMCLFVLPVLSGLILFGWIHQTEEAIHVDYVAKWQPIKDVLWMVWVVGAVTKWAAAWLLSNRCFKSTRWMAAALIWSGAVLAPLLGVIEASSAPFSPIASALTGDYIFMGVRGVAFAILCSLYLIFSKRVKNTYSAASPQINFEQVRQRTVDSLLGALVVVFALGAFMSGVAILDNSLWGLVPIVLAGVGLLWVLARSKE